MTRVDAGVGGCTTSNEHQLPPSLETAEIKLMPSKEAYLYVSIPSAKLSQVSSGKTDRILGLDTFVFENMPEDSMEVLPCMLYV
jgi:hypothetical protein